MFWEILGIEPTNDISKIKSAYAEKAKAFNPEEHPEEFKKIHSAYKAACRFAKTVHNRGDGDVSVDFKVIRRQTVFDVFEPTWTDSDDADKDCSAPELKHVDLPDNKPQTRKTASVRPSEHFDFSAVNDEKTSIDNSRPLTNEEMVSVFFSRLKKLAADPDLRNSAAVWNSFFADCPKKVIEDTGFRTESEKLFYGMLFSEAAAKKIASGFGGEAKAKMLSGAGLYSGSDRYIVDISGKRRVKNLTAKEILLTVLIVIFAVLLITYFLGINFFEASVEQLLNSIILPERFFTLTPTFSIWRL